jgi:hypothetical protein
MIRDILKLPEGRYAPGGWNLQKRSLTPLSIPKLCDQ